LVERLGGETVGDGDGAWWSVLLLVVTSPVTLQFISPVAPAFFCGDLVVCGDRAFDAGDAG